MSAPIGGQGRHDAPTPHPGSPGAGGQLGPGPGLDQPRACAHASDPTSPATSPTAFFACPADREKPIPAMEFQLGRVGLGQLDRGDGEPAGTGIIVAIVNPADGTTFDLCTDLDQGERLFFALGECFLAHKVLSGQARA